MRTFWALAQKECELKPTKFSIPTIYSPRMMQPRRTRFFNRNAGNTTRSNLRNANHLIMYEATRTTGISEPPPVQTTILLSYRFQFNIELTNSSPSTNIIASDVQSALPGGSAAWPYFRVLKVELWGGDNPLGAGGSVPMTLTLGQAGSFTDPGSFTDNGTSGARRAHIAIRPSTMYSSYWWNSASQIVATVSGTGIESTAQQTAILQMTVEARSSSIPVTSLPSP